MYSWQLGKINEDMPAKVAGISNNKGYKFHRSIYNSVDATLANAEFAYDQSLMQLVPLYAGKMKNLKEFYEFRVLLNKKR